MTNGNNLQWQSAEWNDASGVGLVSTTDVWAMWSYTADRSITTGTWYKNGANPNAKPSITTGDFGVGNFQVGRNGSDYNFAGNLDEISIWDVALTEAQLLGLYNSGAPTDLSKEAFESNLTTWWRMGDPSGQASYPTIADSKGSLDLTMTNMVAANITTNVPT